MTLFSSNEFLSALIGALAGGFLSLVGTVVADQLQRHRDQKQRLRKLLEVIKAYDGHVKLQLMALISAQRHIQIFRAGLKSKLTIHPVPPFLCEVPEAQNFKTYFLTHGEHADLYICSMQAAFMLQTVHGDYEELRTHLAKATYLNNADDIRYAEDLIQLCDVGIARALEVYENATKVVAVGLDETKKKLALQWIDKSPWED